MGVPVLPLTRAFKTMVSNSSGPSSDEYTVSSSFRVMILSTCRKPNSASLAQLHLDPVHSNTADHSLQDLAVQVLSTFHPGNLGSQTPRPLLPQSGVQTPSPFSRKSTSLDPHSSLPLDPGLQVLSTLISQDPGTQGPISSPSQYPELGPQRHTWACRASGSPLGKKRLI